MIFDNMVTKLTEGRKFIWAEVSFLYLWRTLDADDGQKLIFKEANLILDQWRKKAQLYKSNAVLIPLGDDFRYNLESEWNDQYKNYEQIIEYINNNPQLNAEIQFGTLEDYFQALREETPEEQLPVLSGDFFTYGDRNQHYWSGYYTSRPYYKNMDRVLLAYFRAAEVISAQATLSKSVKRILALSLRDRVETARQALALFQHHDGVTGTSRTEVKMDYADKMVAAIALCQSVIQQTAYFLLKQPRIQDQVQDDVFFDPDHIYLSDELPSRMTIALDELQPTKNIVVYNSLTYKRQEFVTVIVNKHNVENKNGKTLSGTGLTFQRVALDTCYSNPEVYKFYPVGSGQIFIGDLTGANASNIMDSSLTYTRVREPVGNGGAIALCPMEIRSVFVADDTNQTH